MHRPQRTKAPTCPSLRRIPPHRLACLLAPPAVTFTPHGSMGVGAAVLLFGASRSRGFTEAGARSNRWWPSGHPSEIILPRREPLWVHHAGPQWYIAGTRWWGTGIHQTQTREAEPLLPSPLRGSQRARAYGASAPRPRIWHRASMRSQPMPKPLRGTRRATEDRRGPQILRGSNLAPTGLQHYPGNEGPRGTHDTREPRPKLDRGPAKWLPPSPRAREAKSLKTHPPTGFRRLLLETKG